MTEEQRKRFSESIDRLAGDDELLVELASMVVSDAPELMSELQSNVEQADLTSVATTSHKLKGMFSTFETGSPVIDLQELIHIAHDGEQEKVQSVYRRIEPKLFELMGELQQLVGDAKSHS